MAALRMESGVGVIGKMIGPVMAIVNIAKWTLFLMAIALLIVVLGAPSLFGVIFLTVGGLTTVWVVGAITSFVGSVWHLSDWWNARRGHSGEDIDVEATDSELEVKARKKS
jgi:hypothetical protein